MANKLVFIAAVEDENGNIIMKNESKQVIPGIEEIDRKGFRSAFGDLERAVLDTRKQVSEAITSDYLADLSKKKRILDSKSKGDAEL
jgi:hypothetical protein